MKDIKEITNLEINRKEFILEVAGKYYLDLKMPLPVLSEQGKAKFDNKTKVLRVTMQVDRNKLVEKDKNELKSFKVEDPDIDYIKAEDKEETKHLEGLTNIDTG